MMDMPGEATIIVWNKEQKADISVAGWSFKTNEFLLKSITDLIKMKSVGGIVLYIILLSLAMLAILIHKYCRSSGDRKKLVPI